jgi:hypothetical protein
MDGSKWADPVAALIEVGTNAVWIDGRSMGAPHGDPADTIKSEVAAGRERWRILHPNQKADRVPIGIWLDVRGPARAAVGILEKLSAKHDLVLFGIADSSANVPTDVAERLAAIRAETAVVRKARLISEAMRDALAGCHRDQRGSAEVKDATLAINAARECSCAGTDLDLLEAIIAPPDLPLVHGKMVRLLSRSKAVVILSPDATVQDLISGLPISGAVVVRWRIRP